MTEENAAYGIFDAPKGPKEYEPGIYVDIPNEDYHAAAGISNSGLGLIDQCPAIYYGRRLDPNRPPEKEKGGQLTGTLAHCAILEPKEFDKRYIIGPDVNRNAKKWKDFVDDHPGCTVIKREEYDIAWAMRESVLRLDEIPALLQSGLVEASAFWVDEETGELCKARPDLAHSQDDMEILIDVKTYSSAEPWEFARQAARKGYHRQGAMYSDGWSVVTGRPVLAFIFLVVELEFPHAASAVMLDEDSQDAGWNLYRRNLHTYAECLRNDRWPGYATGVTAVSLPRYALGDD